jgi:hypothetical protein
MEDDGRVAGLQRGNTEEWVINTVVARFVHHGSSSHRTPGRRTPLPSVLEGLFERLLECMEPLIRKGGQNLRQATGAELGLAAQSRERSHHRFSDPPRLDAHLGGRGGPASNGLEVSCGARATTLTP